MRAIVDPIPNNGIRRKPKRAKHICIGDVEYRDFEQDGMTFTCQTLFCEVCRTYKVQIRNNFQLILPPGL